MSILRIVTSLEHANRLPARRRHSIWRNSTSNSTRVNQRKTLLQTSQTRSQSRQARTANLGWAPTGTTPTRNSSHVLSNFYTHKILPWWQARRGTLSHLHKLSGMVTRRQPSLTSLISARRCTDSLNTSFSSCSLSWVPLVPLMVPKDWSLGVDSSRSKLRTFWEGILLNTSLAKLANRRRLISQRRIDCISWPASHVVQEDLSPLSNQVSKHKLEREEHKWSD